MNRTKTISVALLGLVVAGALPAAAFLLAPATSASTQAAATGEQAIFAIENMTCALCPVTVRKAMEGVAGVKSVAVDFDAKTATVVFDPSQATIAVIAAASTGAGYPARVEVE